MQKIKTIVDDLALIGHPLSDAEIVVHTLHGLSNDYKELNAAIRTRETAMTFEELHDKLLDHETFLKRGEGKRVTTPITAQYNHHRSNNNKNRSGSGNHQNNRMGNNNYGNRSISGNPQTNSGNQGFHNPSSSPSNSNFSYNTMGNFTPASHSQHQPWRPNNNHGQPKPICQLCDKIGHTAKVCRSRARPHHNPNWPQANLLTTDHQSNNNNWLVDSGASHHITSDLQNLSVHSDYNGNEDIMVGDGNGLEYGGILGARPE
ncbi:unnamed protein product [Fraxinus pennsylvanica]|uniref:Uncharacterized protein n=1 Tax=Fraxinus pennsylvanica TaxID=56036 RepID=A0AAD2EAZ8_9LAMI|nr:unnamed protein product [Fraxinus pennsylvanica]